MATEILLVNGMDTGWENGAATDIDEGHVSPNTPDGSIISTGEGTGGGKGSVVRLSFQDSALTDGDTVNRVDVFIRCRRQIDADSDIDVQVVIGGTPQGAAVEVSEGAGLAASLTDYGALNDTGWNSDWTAAQLDGIQLDCTATQTGMPTDDVWEIDSAELHIDYTAAPIGQPFPVGLHRQTPIAIVKVRG